MTTRARLPFIARAVPYLPLGLFAALGATLAYLVRLPCRGGGWNDQVSTYTNFCYSDIYPLFFDRRLATQSPYFADVPFDKHVEYPVVLGEVMQAVSWLVRLLEPEVPAQGALFYDLTVILHGRLPGRRRAADGRGGRPDPALGRALVRPRARA